VGVSGLVIAKELLTQRKIIVRIPVGAQVFKNRSTDDVERFLSLIRFENREKLEEMGLDL
jgi:hypothetical protein